MDNSFKFENTNSIIEFVRNRINNTVQIRTFFHSRFQILACDIVLNWHHFQMINALDGRGVFMLHVRSLLTYL